MNLLRFLWNDWVTRITLLSLVATQWCFSLHADTLLVGLCEVYCIAVQMGTLVWAYLRLARSIRASKIHWKRFAELDHECDFWCRECQRLSAEVERANKYGPAAVAATNAQWGTAIKRWRMAIDTARKHLDRAPP